jgi:hypothetical protein
MRIDGMQHLDVPRHRYVRTLPGEPSIVPGIKVRGREQGQCPRCTLWGLAMKHGEEETCPSCNLRIVTYGNGIFVGEGDG